MSTMTRPAWATQTQGSEFDATVQHTVLITVGDGVVSDSSHHPPHSPAGRATHAAIEVNQFAYEDGTVGPVVCDVDDWQDCDAQQCRDLAAALLKAAEIIEAATA